jgi:hypothetical protein
VISMWCVWYQDRRQANAKNKSHNKANIELDVGPESLLTSLLSVPPMSFPSRVHTALRDHHRWVSVYFAEIHGWPRHWRVLSLVTSVVVMLFVQSLTYALTQSDDGSCGRLVTQQSCVSKRSSYRGGASMCGWDSRSERCFYLQPDQSVFVMLFVTVVSGILSTPFATVGVWLCRSILPAPVDWSAATKTRTVPLEPLTAVVPMSDVEQGKDRRPLVAWKADEEALRCQSQLQEYHNEMFPRMTGYERDQWLGEVSPRFPCLLWFL